MIRYVELKECGLFYSDFYRMNRVYVLDRLLSEIDKTWIYGLNHINTQRRYEVGGNFIRPCFQDTFPTKEEVEMLVMLNYDLPDELLEFL